MINNYSKQQPISHCTNQTRGKISSKFLVACTLMSLVGCIRTLVANTGLSDLLKSAFRSVEKMLSGNKLQKNIRALSIMFKKNTTVSPAG